MSKRQTYIPPQPEEKIQLWNILALATLLFVAINIAVIFDCAHDIWRERAPLSDIQVPAATLAILIGFTVLSVYRRRHWCRREEKVATEQVGDTRDHDLR